MVIAIAAEAVSYNYPSDSITFQEEIIFKQLNKYRKAHGRRPVKMHWKIRRAARERSREMAQRHYFSHTSPSGRHADRLLHRRHVSYSWGTENIAWISVLKMSSKERAMRIFRMWVNSGPHRRAMLKRRATHTGIGAARNGAYYFTMILVDKRT